MARMECADSVLEGSGMAAILANTVPLNVGSNFREDRYIAAAPLFVKTAG
jgi:hypothetical protein